MQMAYVLKGHISAEGTIVLDEPATLVPGPVLVTVLPLADQPATSSGYTEQEHAALWSQIEAIVALAGPPAADDGRGAKEYKAILYGPDAGTSDVR